MLPISLARQIISSPERSEEHCLMSAQKVLHARATDYALQFEQMLVVIPASSASKVKARSKHDWERLENKASVFTKLSAGVQINARS
jgi:hypothetical protein